MSRTRAVVVVVVVVDVDRRFSPSRPSVSISSQSVPSMGTPADIMCFLSRRNDAFYPQPQPWDQHVAPNRQLLWFRPGKLPVMGRLRILWLLLRKS